MSRGPLIFGVPAWIGVRKRLGKKRLKQYFGSQYRTLMLLREMKVGDLYNDCSGLNRRLALAVPAYETRGHKKGKVLFEFDLEAEDGSWCSFKHCGVEPPISYEAALRDRDRFVKQYSTEGKDIQARRWSSEVTTIHADGTFSIDAVAEDRLHRHAERPSVTNPVESLPRSTPRTSA